MSTTVQTIKISQLPPADPTSTNNQVPMNNDVGAGPVTKRGPTAGSGVLVMSIGGVIGGLTQVESRVTAQTRSFVATAQAINVQGYVTQNDGLGAVYKRFSLASLGGYPTSSYFRSLDRFMPDGSTNNTNGGYWVILFGDRILVSTLGAPADCNINFAVPADTQATGSGTNNFQPLTDMVTLMTLLKKPGQLSGYYYCGGQLVNNSGQIIYGTGETSSGLLCDANATSSANHLTVSGGGYIDMEIRCNAWQAKAADNGQWHACVEVDYDGYFSANPIVEIADFTLRNLRLTRCVNSRSATALTILGNISGGFVSNINDIGSPKPHSTGILLHWSAWGTHFTGPINQTYHVRDVTLEKLYFVSCTDNGAAVSSTYNINIEDLTVNGSKMAFYMLPGDETTFYAPAAQQPLIGKGNRLGKLYFSGIVADAAFTEIVTLFSVGTSIVRANTFDCLDVGWQFDEIEGDGNGVAIDGVHVYRSTGEYTFGKVDIKNLAAGSRSFYMDNSTAAVTATFVQSNVFPRVVRASNVTILNGEIDVPQVTTVFGFETFGDTESLTLAANLLASATSLTVTTPITQVVMKGETITVGGQTVLASNFAPVGATVIPITAMPVAITAPATVIIDRLCNDANITMHTIGAIEGFRIRGTKGVINGFAERSGTLGMRARTGTDITTNLSTRDGGLTNRSSKTSKCYDIQVESGANVRHVGGHPGIGGSLSQESGTLNANSVLGATSITLGTALVQALSVGTTILLNAGAVIATVNAAAAIGATVITVQPLSAGVSIGQTYAIQRYDTECNINVQTGGYYRASNITFGTNTSGPGTAVNLTDFTLVNCYLDGVITVVPGLLVANWLASVMTVAQLSTAAAAGQGARRSVTDATATTFHSTVAGGGANFVPVISDGTNWLIG